MRSVSRQARSFMFVGLCAIALASISLAQVETSPGEPATPPPAVPPVAPPSSVEPSPKLRQPGPVHGGNPVSQEQLRCQAMAVALERVHGHAVWATKAALQADLTVSLDGKTVFDGTIWHNVADGRTRVKTKDGAEYGSDGQHIWSLPSSAPAENAPFHARAWPFFIVAPFTLRDPGMELSEHKPVVLKGRTSETMRVGLPAPSVGQTFVIYNHNPSFELRAVVFANPWMASESADDSPAGPTHLAMFEDTAEFEGVKVATTWKFFKWTADRGVQGEVVGEGKVSNVKFITPEPGFFDKPADAREISS